MIGTSAALQRLKSVVSGLDSVIVAFSGGVDSALVAVIAAQELGAQSLALTAISPTLPKEEQEAVSAFVKRWDLAHVAVPSNELNDEAYARNDGTRCYHCKSELFDLAEDERVRRGFAWVVDGTLLDDLGDHRPGLVAAKEHKVRHPLVEAGFTKEMVRSIAKEIGLEVWDKPSFACLGSRFAVGTRVTEERVVQVAAVESTLRRLGFSQFRVRWHQMDQGVLARIELAPAELEQLAAPRLRAEVKKAAVAAGFKWIVLDLVGYGERG